MSVQVAIASSVDREALDAFLARSFRPTKSEFLRQHGDWWHRGPDNRWVLLEHGEILGYCAVIPAVVRLGGEEIEAAWWVDLVIDRAARGRGLQRHFDELIRARPITLGFPNALAAAIHRRHGWGVREDLAVHLLPVAGGRMPALARRGRPTAVALGVLLSILGRILVRRGPRARVATLDEAAIDCLLAAARRAPSWTSTERSPTWLRWRYLESPNPTQHWLLEHGGSAAVLRLAPQEGATVARLLELTGSMRHGDVRAIVAAAYDRCRAMGAAQITALSSNRETASALTGAGARLRARARSCWYSSDARLDATLASSTHHWTLGDADHDEP